MSGEDLEKLRNVLKNSNSSSSSNQYLQNKPNNLILLKMNN